MKDMFGEMIAHRHLIFILTWRDIKIKYKQTIMGFLWAILMPMLIVVAGIFIRTAFSHLSGSEVNTRDLVSISVKALPWSFFIGSIRFGTNSLIGNSNLVTKIYFPREVFPISAVMANLFDFSVASLVLVVLLWVSGTGLSIHAVWVLPLILFLIMFTMGLSMILACTNLFFRDVKYIVEVIITFAIFFTPVFYDASMLGKWETLLLLNPVGAILENMNSVLVLQHPPNMIWFAYSGIMSVSSLFLFWAIFHKAEIYFAENI